MTTWVALLRGVNVNGVTVRSGELRETFRDLGFTGVTTVLASGNVRFDADEDATERESVKTRIERALETRFGYDAWIVLLTLEELRTALGAFPFDAEDPLRQPYVVFCSDAAVLDALRDAAAQVDPGEDPTECGFGVLYWSPPKGRSTDTPLAKELARARYRTTTTTRNLRTLVKIAG